MMMTPDELDKLLNEWEESVDRQLKLDLRERKPEEIRCECGAEKAKTTHANWCPLWERYEE
jgi:hypothetical protein